ncbi:MAG: phytanoyl-CoA dioxygenase family protein, partial [Gemmatimonadota bacterium]|nr:phytanoyl-CoA dioxygenase family protein [Gemmatimonadota bacterium]
LPHPQKIARLWFPQYTEHTTPMHQDFVHFQGSFNTYTFWAPVGDCPLELGGLAVLPGSHKIGKVREHHFSLGAGGLAVDESELTGRWLSANYEAGDALIFPSLTVHQALPNYTEDHLRISLDNRYQAQGEPIAQHMLEPHLTGVTDFNWDACYAGWQSESLQYYWQDLYLEVVPQSSRWGDQGFAEALSLARDGDERALYQLRRIARRDPESERGQQALQLLHEGNV